VSTEDRPTAAADPLAALRAAPSPTPGERLRGAIASIPPDARPWAVALTALVVLALVGGAVLVVQSAGSTHGSPNGSVVDLPFAGTTVASSTTEAAPPVVAHAAGAVANPGVYRLAPGSRVADLLAAAGGTTAEADVDRLNLAAPVQDGVRLYVPRVGEIEVPPLADSGQPADPGAAGSASGAPGPIDLNRASLEQLEELPGIGPSIGQAIIDHRTRNGPFRSVDDLLDVRGVGPARLEQLRPLVKV
jgi:competence protein ComEA